MMKEKIFGLQLLCLLLVIPRNITADPIATPDEMKEIEDILTEAMNLLKNNMLSSDFEHAIFNLKTEISKLPFEFDKDRIAMLEILYISQDRLVQLRTTLTVAAGKLKNSSEVLLKEYEKYKPGTDEKTYKGLLDFGKSQFLRHANNVKCELKDAEVKTTAIQEKLSGAKAFLDHVNAKLKEEVDKIESKENSEVGIRNTEVGSDMLINEPEKKLNISVMIKCTHHICVITIVIKHPGIAQFEGSTIAQEDQPIIITELKKQLNDLKQAQNAALTLDSHVKKIRLYLTREVNLIINWKQSLNESINDHKHFNLEQLKFAISGIKQRLGFLIQACKDYLAHDIPLVLISRNT